MNLYAITVPNTRGLLNIFENVALDLAGGYTFVGLTSGSWRDDTGTVHTDKMALYHIACTAPIFKRVVTLAFKLFPTELAIFTAKLGTATIVTREG